MNTNDEIKGKIDTAANKTKAAVDKSADHATDRRGAACDEDQGRRSLGR